MRGKMYGMLAIVLGGLCGLPRIALGQVTVNLNPSKDNTIFSESGSTSNGSGSDVFVGVTGPLASDSTRRGLMAFNLAGIPSNATITNVSLQVTVDRAAFGADNVELHKLLTNWGEGTSAGSGQGALASAGDATWINTFFPSQTWSSPGGDFSSVVSASQLVGGGGTYAFSSPGMASDVLAWIGNPSSNFGWELRGDETGTQNAKGISSREGTSPPLLSITYTVPTPEPGNVLILGMICTAGLLRRHRQS